MRMFVAIGISEEIRESCLKIMELLSKSGSRLKTVAPENIHITLKFLGEVREDDVKKVKDVLMKEASLHMPFRISFSVLGYFGSVRFPKAIWIGISVGRERISDLSIKLNDALSFINRDERKPSPHLTLARVKDITGAESLVETIKENRDVKLSDLDVKEILLMKSDLKPEGPEYSIIGRYPLSKVN